MVRNILLKYCDTYNMFHVTRLRGTLHLLLGILLRASFITNVGGKSRVLKLYIVTL